MTGAQVGPYDFRKPRQLAEDIEHELSAWQHTAATLIMDRWEQQLGVRVAWETIALRTCRRSQLCDQLGQTNVCFSLSFADRPGVMWVALPRRFAVAMLANAMGEDPEEMPEDRQLSDVELAVIELAIQELARVATDAQPCGTPLVCEFVGQRRIQEIVREFSEQEPIVAAEFRVSAACGEETLTWLLSQQAVLSFMTNLGEARKASAGGDASLEETVTQIPMQLVVELGSTKLHVSDLLNLEPGDVVVLDQRVCDPLRAEVCGTPVFQGWPGRIGSRQAFQIAELVQPGD